MSMTRASGQTIHRLDELADVIFSTVDKKVVDGEEVAHLCNYVDVYKNSRLTSAIEFSKGSVSRAELQRFRLRKGDIALTKDSESSEDIGLVALVSEDMHDVVLGYHLALVRPRTEKILPACLAAALETSTVRRHFQRKAVGVVRAGLSLDAVRSAPVAVPRRDQQGAIARAFDAIECTREAVRRLISAKKAQVRGLALQLLSGRKRFKQFRGHKWESVALGELISYMPRKVRKPSGKFLSAGVRSHGRGVFLKEQFLSEAIALEELFVLKHRDLIVNITFGWEGAVAIVPPEADGALVSHRFPTFEIDERKVLVEFMRHVIRTKRFVFDIGVASPGGAGRNRVLNRQEFLEIKIPLPSTAEQERIAQVLNTCGHELDLLKRLEQLSNQEKRALVSRVFRVDLAVPEIV